MRTIVFDGDSMTAPNPADGGTEWPLLLKEQLWSGYSGWQNYAKNGQTVDQMLQDQNGQIIARYKFSNTMLMVWAGINDLHLGVNADSLIERITIYHQKSDRYSIRTFAFTLTASQIPKYAPVHQQIETERLKFNSWLRANYKLIGADALVDLAADKRIGEFDSVLNQQYFQADRLHMNQGGRKVVAELVKAQL
ncbi:SGNH/GDSL hydrolase family protein [Adhaeribacter radiodurans]|uniref:SGNH/GDSL hydrolase family protein n=1 Tax=Adhaeribacter radiodurans TaxID=2745197 RepID=A0A7L7LCG7_9BACT|nr:SGNH/GDSL hydrolase family protein [Adhaeribacter radiodurans]QMU30437.1 SGNH/GDSL hydrolase family protein [Adhaeribacter radiodurans]